MKLLSICLILFHRSVRNPFHCAMRQGAWKLLQAGDGAAISEAPTLVVEADSDSELLLFDLA